MSTRQSAGHSGAQSATRQSLWLNAIILVAFLAASSAPTPLYRLYQQQWGFSATVLTMVFAAYSLALLLSLLVTGRISDHIGRRPAIMFALSLQAIAMCCFMWASGPAWLLGARVLQGVATGVATAAVGAALLDLARERGAFINSIAPMIGMALGALGSTALMVYAPGPLRTIYVLLLLVFLVALGFTWRAPETAVLRAGGWQSLRPRVTVPVQARAALLAVTPANAAVWMLGGFYLSLMPSLIASAAQASTPWLGGLVVAALTLSGAVAVLVASRLATHRALLSGEIALASGVVVILLGANHGSASLLLAGSVIGGFGFGATFLGAVRSVILLAEPHERAALMGAFYVESYLANSLPTMAVGYLAQQAGLLSAVNVYSGVILALVLLAMLLWLRQRRAAACQA